MLKLSENCKEPSFCRFQFGDSASSVTIQEQFPRSRSELHHLTGTSEDCIAVCDINTAILAQGLDIPFLTLPTGEEHKQWPAVEKILRFARAKGLGRDGFFIGIGGGVIGDLTGFAASVYMRGARLCLVSTTLLGMADASLGGKTGIDLAGLKNLAGSLYPAETVYMPLPALNTLPEREWKSGMAELIKTAVLDSEDFLQLTKKLLTLQESGRNSPAYRECLAECISRAVAYKGSVVEADPRETGELRPLLNLGHSFGHALEGAAGLGAISHGEAVAWGMARSCELGLKLGVTPPERAKEITDILVRAGYETRSPHPMMKSADMLWSALLSDKKQIAGKLRFIVPSKKSARVVSAADSGDDLLRSILHIE